LANGDSAALRGPDWNDLDDLTEYINGLVREHAEITKTELVTRESEAEWLGERLSEIENGRVIMLVADVNGRVAAVGEVGLLTGERAHSGYLGVGVTRDKRRVGLGRSMMEALLELAKKAGLKIVILDAYGTNTAAISLYEKVGFKEVGRIPKGILRDGRFIDLVRMTAEL
jgi:ribosomal protein S18 acetylase RimI-like enzyme